MPNQEVSPRVGDFCALSMERFSPLGWSNFSYRVWKQEPFHVDKRSRLLVILVPALLNQEGGRVPGQIPPSRAMALSASIAISGK